MSFRCARASRLFLFLVLAASRVCAQTPGQTSSSAPAASHPSQKAHRTANLDPSLDPGVVGNGVYRNAALGFSSKIPAGWVLRTDEMNARDEDASASTASSATQDSGERVLLAAFSRPPDAMAEDVNSSILIAAESVAAYPGLKNAAQYFGPLSEVAKAQGFKVVNEPYDFLAGTKMVVRGDFQKDVGSRVMRQSTLVILSRGYAVSFTFIGGTEEETEELIQGLSFTPAAKAAK